MAPVSPKMRDGTDILLNGLTYRIAVLGPDETSFQPPTRLTDGRELSEADRNGLVEILRLLDDLSQIVNALNERLVDRLDGLTTRGVLALLECENVDPAFGNALAPFAFGLLKHGTNVFTERGSVIVPPRPRNDFERQIQRLPKALREEIPWARVLDNLFDAVPLATQGFYLFETDGDLERFERTLGEEYARICSELRELFSRAVAQQAGMSREDWELLDKLSQRALDLQKAPLEAALEAGPDACRCVATRVRFRCDPAGHITCSARHYSEEFAEELCACARLLRSMHDAAPAFASELRDVLADLADWCTASNPGESWAESRPVWIAADDPDNLIDINLTFEEKVSRIGSKGGLQLLACTFDDVPDKLRDIYASVREKGRRQNLNILFLRQLVVGGGASNYTLAGEKLPDPGGRPRYKVMIFTNTTRSALVLMNRALIASATDVPASHVERIADSAKLAVLFHEYGHTLGDYAEFLGDLGGSVEETNAEASSIYETARLAPEHLDQVLVLEACWTPVRRAMQGPTESHSHANIVLFDELRRAGALAVVSLDGRKLVRVLDRDLAVRVCFDLAMRMRLWEAGLPVEPQRAVLEPFSPVDGTQDERIAAAARALLDRLGEERKAELRRQVLDECRAWFAMSRLHEISQPLLEVIETMPGFQPVSVVPSDRRFGTMLAW